MRMRHIIGVTLIALLPGLAFAQQVAPKDQGQARQAKGRLTKLTPNQFVLRTSDNQEVTFYVDPQTRYLLRGQPGRYTDLRPDTEVGVTYTLRDNRNHVGTVTVGEAAEPPAQPQQGKEPPPAQAQATAVEGTVVRVVGQDQVVVRTNDNKEVVIYVTPQTKYVFDDKPGQLTELQPGASVRVEYDVRDRRFMGRSILRRRGK